MDHREKLLKLVQEKGPLLPSQINKELNTNVLFASAMLSEMVDTKKLRLTSLKIGGSPLYYSPGQEEQLQKFSEKLNEKDQRTFELLKKDKVLRDKDQEPLTRVSLREIKDFAVPLQVTVKEKKELFWKFYLLPDDDAEKIIKDYLEKHNYFEEKKEEKKKPETEKKAEKKEEKKEERRERPAKEAQTTITAASEPVKAEPVEVQEPVCEAEVEREDKIEEIKVMSEPEVNYSYSFSYSADAKKEKERPSAEEKKQEVEEAKEPEYPEDDEFFAKVSGYFEANGIKIEEFELVRKGSEYDFIVLLPSPVGELKYYCKAKSKKKLNDGDISSAYVTGQMKQLPMLFLTLGDMTGKAQEMMKGFKSFVHKQIP